MKEEGRSEGKGMENVREKRMWNLGRERESESV